MSILWLASWYPSAVAPFNGDFIQRHAKAASLFEDIHVLHVVKDSKGTITKNFKKTINKQGRLTETIVYYFVPHLGPLARVLSAWKYRRNFKKLVGEHMAQFGKPDAVHVHVGMKAGMIAQWVKKKYKQPYFLSEHWSGLLPEGIPALSDFPKYYQRGYQRVVKNALSTSAVSVHLASQIEKRFEVNTPSVIPNVVDTSLFTPVSKATNIIPRFIHISGLTFEKNGAAIIDAFKILSEKGQPYQLDIFGSKDQRLVRKAHDLELSTYIHFHPEVPQTALAPFVQQADALILYSLFETFGCVVIEAHACGIPVIASDIPALKELIIEGSNGMLAAPDDAELLAQVLIEFIRRRRTFEPKLISAQASRFSYDVVGKTIIDWYAQNLRI